MDRTPAEDGFYMPPDWGPHERCWMAWPCRIDAWGEAMDLACLATAALARAIAKYEPVTMLVTPELIAIARLQLGSLVTIWEADLDDSWSRDIAPNFLIDGEGRLAGAVFDFNAWGNKHHDYDKDAKLGQWLLHELDLPCYRVPMVLEGGAIHVDGSGTLITTESVAFNSDRNPTLDRRQIEERLAMYFGIRKVIWLPGGLVGDRADGHVDKVARFVAPGRMMCAVAAHRGDPNHGVLSDNLARLARERDALGRPLELLELPLPAPLRQPDGRFLVRSYLDFYLANNAVYVPAFDDAGDEEAANLIAAAFPRREMVQLDMADIAFRGGAVHSLTQQQPKV
ncbi:MAG: agmatine deiminase family protein [Proteobacteria bacterium]|nr:agmatine deiminase family protein [Pseudomonadota bacterium]